MGERVVLSYPGGVIQRIIRVLGSGHYRLPNYPTPLPHDLDAKHNLELALQMIESEAEDTAVSHPAQQEDRSQLTVMVSSPTS